MAAEPSRGWRRLRASPVPGIAAGIAPTHAHMDLVGNQAGKVKFFKGAGDACLTEAATGSGTAHMDHIVGNTGKAKLFKGAEDGSQAPPAPPTLAEATGTAALDRLDHMS